MEYLKQLEKEHFEYAQVIDDFLAKPRTNEQLVDLAKQMKNYLLYSGDQLKNYNEYIETFMGALSKLP